jgi:hypothetical protein
MRGIVATRVRAEVRSVEACRGGRVANTNGTRAGVPCLRSQLGLLLLCRLQLRLPQLMPRCGRRSHALGSRRRGSAASCLPGPLRGWVPHRDAARRGGSSAPKSTFRSTAPGRWQGRFPFTSRSCQARKASGEASSSSLRAAPGRDLLTPSTWARRTTPAFTAFCSPATRSLPTTIAARAVPAAFVARRCKTPSHRTTRCGSSATAPQRSARGSVLQHGRPCRGSRRGSGRARLRPHHDLGSLVWDEACPDICVCASRPCRAPPARLCRGARPLRSIRGGHAPGDACHPCRLLPGRGVPSGHA